MSRNRFEDQCKLPFLTHQSDDKDPCDGEVEGKVRLDMIKIAERMPGLGV